MFHQNTNQKFISPLVWVLLAAFFVRLIAVIFSKGYLTHDDHFIPVTNGSFKSFLVIL